MSALSLATDALQALEEELDRCELYAGGEDSLRIAERIRDVRQSLPDGDVRWIGTAEARRLLGVESEDTVSAWARLGYLRGRMLRDGRLELGLDDVLKEREEREELAAFGGDDLSHEEMMHLLRPRLYPPPSAAETNPASRTA